MNQLDTKARLVNVDQAQRWLKRHEQLVKQDPTKKNRRLSPKLVRRYAIDMAAGRWHLNGETLKLGGDGRIIDGQHRLAACIKANVTFRSLVVENVDDESFKTIDIGRVRTSGDLLHIDGHPSSVVLGAALLNVWRWEQGEGKAFVSWDQSPSKAELFEVLERHPRLEDYVNGIAVRLGVLMSPGLSLALVYLLSQKDTALAELFFSSLNTGLGLKADDPVYALRERLIRDRQLTPRPPASHTAEMVLRAWHATRRGEKLTRMQRPRRDVKK